MAALTLTRARVRAADETTKVRQKILGEAASLGDWVTLATDGKAYKTSGSTGKTIGMIVSLGAKGGTDGAAGESAGIAYWGPVTGYSAMTPGYLAYLGAAGAVADSGTLAVGYADAADVLFIMPLITTVAS